MNQPQHPSESRVAPRRWRFWLIVTALLCLLPLLASGWGLWVGSDRLAAFDKADCVIVLSGNRRHEISAQWINEGRTPELWIVRRRESLLAKMGIEERDGELDQRRLLALHVPPDQLRIIELDAESAHFPEVLKQLGKHCQDRGMNQIVILCLAHEPRFLRQITDAVLPAEQAERFRFVPLPNDRYVMARWWTCRAGWKDVGHMGHHIVSNWICGPTEGFETPWFDPDAGPILQVSP